MTNWTESTWMGPVMGQELEKVMATFVKYPPRKLQSMGYDGPIEISKFQKFQYLRDMLAKEGVHLSLPTGN